MTYECQNVKNLSASDPCHYFAPLLPYEKWCESCKAQERKEAMETKATALMGRLGKSNMGIKRYIGYLYHMRAS